MSSVWKGAEPDCQRCKTLLANTTRCQIALVLPSGPVALISPLTSVAEQNQTNVDKRTDIEWNRLGRRQQTNPNGSTPRSELMQPELAGMNFRQIVLSKRR